MLGFLVKRVVWAGVVLVTISVFTFILFFVIPPDRQQLGRGAATVDISIRETFGLERGTLPEEYGQFAWNLVRHGSLGTSYTSGDAVTDVLARAIPVTASLVVGGVLLWMLIAIPIGILSALRARTFLDRATMLLVLVGISAHPAWIALILSYFVGFRLNLTPIAGYCDLINPAAACGGLGQWASHLLLPWLTFAILFAALYARMIRASVLESLNEDYVRTARAKGAPRWLVLRSHVCRNAVLPVVTMLGMDAAVAFGGAIFIERVFGLPGVGTIALTALHRRDLPVIMGVVLFVTAVIVVFNMIIDLVYAWLDPRVRTPARAADVEREPEPHPRAHSRRLATGSAP